MIRRWVGAKWLKPQVRVVPGSLGSIAAEPLDRHLAASLSDELDVVQRLQ